MPTMAPQPAMVRRGAELVCDVGGLAHADAATVDALARLQLAARRLGWSIRLRNASDELRELLELMGLGEVVPCCPELPLGVRGQTEQGEQPGGVEEEGHPADPIP
jgi:ABC-type transporter Mla MlaB component